MRIHFIAIGGAAMHNLALALHSKGYTITGSDDEIFDPSRSRLEKAGLLPPEYGWYPEKISAKLDAIILGMHARPDNPELQKAQELGLKVYSYPEFLYEQTKNKKRVVIGGSHGKTTITSMIMHVLRACGKKFDYMVGAQIEGFDTMVSLSEETDLAVFEGDEYLSSPIDPRPKFHLYKPHIALLSGIGWDHINVFPTFENYLEQFEIFINQIEQNGSLIYFNGDSEIKKIVANQQNDHLSLVPYTEANHNLKDGACYLKGDRKEWKLKIFGDHNLQNLSGAREVCKKLGVSEEEFNSAIATFKGSAKRLQKLYSDENKVIFLDFAHSPSKVKGTLNAVKKLYAASDVIAVFELHTFSSLNKNFLAEYKGTMDMSDYALVYFNPEVIAHKKLPELSKEEVSKAFNNPKLMVETDLSRLKDSIVSIVNKNHQVFLFMSSGNFGGENMNKLVTTITKNV